MSTSFSLLQFPKYRQVWHTVCSSGCIHIKASSESSRSEHSIIGSTFHYPRLRCHTRVPDCFMMPCYTGIIPSEVSRNTPCHGLVQCILCYSLWGDPSWKSRYLIETRLLMHVLPISENPLLFQHHRFVFADWKTNREFLTQL